jgi:sec-independent protein translocase protein TatA
MTAAAGSDGNINVIYRRRSMFGLGTSELILILIIVVVLFGASRLPQIGKGLGEAIKNFKKGLGGESSEIDVTPKKDEEAKKPAEVEKKKDA